MKENVHLTAIVLLTTIKFVEKMAKLTETCAMQDVIMFCKPDQDLAKII